ncbi:MAG: hypothetical protein R3C68_07945 [Myxococcota bacterium]
MLASTLAAILCTATPHMDAPIVPEARALSEPGRYESKRSFDETIAYYERVFRSSGGVRWKNIVNLPGIKAKHLASLRKNTHWAGINIYDKAGSVRIFVIPREEAPGTKTRKNARK